jgi:hypothetical protein
VQKKFNLNIFSKATFKLSNLIVKKILKLKSTHYKFSISEHNKWFKNNIKQKDIHNIIFFKKKLVGYNCLRKLKIIDNNISEDKFILFDTLIIDFNFRKLGLSKFIMKKSNQIIKKKKAIGILYCKKEMISYYTKFNWSVIQRKQIKLDLISKKTLIPMIFNLKKNYIKKIKIKLCDFK